MSADSKKMKSTKLNILLLLI